MDCLPVRAHTHTLTHTQTHTGLDLVLFICLGVSLADDDSSHPGAHCSPTDVLRELQDTRKSSNNNNNKFLKLML